MREKVNAYENLGIMLYLAKFYENVKY